MAKKDKTNLKKHMLEGNRLRLLEELNGVITNILALTAVGIGSDIQDYESNVIHEYLGAIDTLLQKAQALCLQIIKTYFSSKLVSENVADTKALLTKTENSQLEPFPE